MDALPFLPHVPLTRNQPKPKLYAESPQTIGEHIKRARLMRGLTQAQAGAAMGVNSFTVKNWEKGHTEPAVAFIPAVLRFLGYDPYPEPLTLPDRMLAKRRAMGWTIAEAAHQFGVDEETWGCWERSIVVPWPRYGKRLTEFVGAATVSAS